LPCCADEIARCVSRAAGKRLARALGRRTFETSQLWPRLDTISCWADGSSAIPCAQLSALCPQAMIEPKGLLATEAAITLPWDGGVGCAPALTSAFIEFVGRDGEFLMAHELAEGSDYRIVVTTWGGLYRYDMGDLVRYVRREGAVPRLAFLGRAGLVSDMVGEKLTEAFVAGVLARLPIAAALIPRQAPRPHYELWLDDEIGSLDAAANVVEDGLRENPQYSYARAIGQLGACIPLWRPGFLAARNAARAAAGARMGDLKPTALILDEA
jgi:GH3 auxin-responsive promoter